MKSITDLPDQDLYPLIFRNLSIEDLFNCRLVNKQFKYFSDHTNGLNKLIIGQPHSRFDINYWFYDNKLIDDKDIISLECFRAIKLLSIFNLDKYLKYLKIYDKEFKLEELSNLINLESLEFGRNYYHHDQQIINLNNLKVLVSNNLSFELNAPKLEEIKFDDINQIKLDCNPESIKHLITWNYDNKLEIFRNLEIIELRKMGGLSENLLIIFKNLKQLKIEFSSSSETSNNILIKILDDKIKLKKEIDVYVEGIKIENIEKFNDIKESYRYSKWKFRLNNYVLLDSDLSSINRLDYEDLEECVINIRKELPSNFFDKFQNINFVDVNTVNDVNGFNWFLNNLQYLIELTIYSRVSLDEVFYNNLPNTIRYLTIYNEEDINYDFILKLSKLIKFHTSVRKDLFDLAFTSFLNLKYLKEFSFYLNRREILIQKRGKYFQLCGEKLDHNQFVEKCDLIRRKIRSIRK